MLRIGICDDIYDARLVLRAALERVLEKRRVQGQFREFSSGEGLLRWLESHAGELDLVFLDMEMGELDGMETARRLRAADAGLQLVFVTGYAEHVFDGYSVGALGYLLKPPKAEQLEEVLDRAQAALVRDLDRAYICRSGDTHYRIPIANILYFVSDRRQVACVTAGREYTFYGKLDTVAAEVGADFVRIHQRLFPLQALCPLCPPPEWALLEGAALSDPGGVHRHGDLDRRPQPALYAAGVFRLVPPLYPG